MDGFEMKRSEMEKIIIREIGYSCGYDPGTTEVLYPPQDYLAFIVLNAVLKAGMQPPYAEFKPLEGEAIGFVPYIKTIWANKWEPEDE